MSRFNVRATTAAAFAVVLGAQAFTAAAQAQSYPRSITSGENTEWDYGPGPHGNIVGGGALTTRTVGRDTYVSYNDPSFVQQPRRGMVPLTIGNGEDSTTVWVPAGTDRTALALVGQDGSLPQQQGGARPSLFAHAGN